MLMAHMKLDPQGRVELRTVAQQLGSTYEPLARASVVLEASGLALRVGEGVLCLRRERPLCQATQQAMADVSEFHRRIKATNTDLEETRAVLRSYAEAHRENLFVTQSDIYGTAEELR